MYAPGDMAAVTQGNCLRGPVQYLLCPGRPCDRHDHHGSPVVRMAGDDTRIADLAAIAAILTAYMAVLALAGMAGGTF